MTNTEHKKILADLDALITSFEAINEKNGKHDAKRKNLEDLILMLAEAYSYFEYHDLDLDAE